MGSVWLAKLNFDKIKNGREIKIKFLINLNFFPFKVQFIGGDLLIYLMLVGYNQIKLGSIRLLFKNLAWYGDILRG